MLAATVASTLTSSMRVAGPYIQDQLGNFYTNGGSSKVFVSTSNKKGSEVGSFSISGLSPADQPARVSLTGRNAAAFTVQRIEVDGTVTYSIRVANSNLVRTFSRFDLTLNVQYASGVAPVTRSIVIVTATAQTIMMNENPTEGQLLGRLPVGMRGARMQYSMVGATNSDDISSFQQLPISIGPGGRILAHPRPNLFVSPVPIDHITNAYYPWILINSPTLFDDESVSPAPSTNGTVHSGDVLIEAYDPLRNTTQRAVIHVQLRNIDEPSTINSQWVQVGLDGSGGGIAYSDPDRSYNGSNNPFSGPHEVKILEGNSEGLFEIVPGNFPVWYSRTGVQLRVAKPELLAGLTSFTLKVQLLEKGRAVGEATVNVNVVPHVWAPGNDIVLYSEASTNV